MLETHPGTGHVAAGPLSAAIAACGICAQVCTACADDCLGEGNPDLASCIRLNLDCADVCSATARVICRQTEVESDVLRTMLEACIAACRACADECARHADHHEHCAVCTEVCRECETACARLLEHIA